MVLENDGAIGHRQRFFFQSNNIVTMHCIPEMHSPSIHLARGNHFPPVHAGQYNIKVPTADLSPNTDFAGPPNPHGTVEIFYPREQ